MTEPPLPPHPDLTPDEAAEARAVAERVKHELEQLERLVEDRRVDAEP